MSAWADALAAWEEQQKQQALQQQAQQPQNPLALNQQQPQSYPAPTPSDDDGYQSYSQNTYYPPQAQASAPAAPNNVGTGPNDANGNPIQTTYNSNLFAGDSQAAALAKQYGGTVMSDPLREAGGGTPGSPFDMPNANYIQMPNGSVVNAGQIAQWQAIGRQDLIDNEMKNGLGSKGNGAAGTGAESWYQQYDPTGVAGGPAPIAAPPPPKQPTTIAPPPASGTPTIPRTRTGGAGAMQSLGGDPSARRLPPGVPQQTDDHTGAGGYLGDNGAGVGVSPGASHRPSSIYAPPSKPSVAGGGDGLSTPPTTIPPPAGGTPRPPGNGTINPPIYRPPQPTHPPGPTQPPPPTGVTPPPTGVTPPFPGTTGIHPPNLSIPAGANPSFPTWSTGDGTNGAYVGGDPGYMASATANRAQDYGNLFENNYGNAYADAQVQSRQYQDQADQAYNALNQTPGYTSQETSDITRAPELQGAMTTADQFNSNILTPQEQAAMTGDPNSVTRAFNPNAITSTASQGSAWTKDQYGKSYQAAQDALNQGQTAAQGTLGQYGTNLRGQYKAMSGNVNSALDSSDAALAKNLQQTKDAYGNIIDPTKLGISDATVAGLKDQAGRQIGLNYAAAQDDLTRRAQAAGNVNPLSLNASRQSMMRSQSIDNADAVTNADISAREAQRKANMDIAGLQMNANAATGQMGQSGAEFSGAQRVGAQQNLGAAGMGAESEIGQAGLNTDLSMTGLRAGTESAYGTLGANVGATTNAQNIAATEAAGNTAISQAQYADSQAAARAAQVAQNRQTTAQANQAQQYQQGYYTNNALSQRYQGVAQQRIQGQQAARNYWQGQGQYQGSQANAASANRISGAQTSLNGMSQGANTAMGTEIGRRSTRPVTIGTGGVSVGI